jgi:uncharacterized membrane protein YvbJ
LWCLKIFENLEDLEMFCGSCGIKREEGGKFCAVCGTGFGTQRNSETNIQAAGNTKPYIQNPSMGSFTRHNSQRVNQWKHTKVGLITVASIFGAVLIALLIIGLSGRNEQSPQSIHGQISDRRIHNHQ